MSFQQSSQLEVTTELEANSPEQVKPLSRMETKKPVPPWQLAIAKSIHRIN